MSAFLDALTAAHPYLVRALCIVAVLVILTSPLARVVGKRVSRRVRREVVEFAEGTGEAVTRAVGRVSG